MFHKKFKRKFQNANRMNTVLKVIVIGLDLHLLNCNAKCCDNTISSS